MSRTKITNPKSEIRNPKSESGMSLISVMAGMVIFATMLLIVAPTVQMSVQREKEIEAIRRGEEVANAIRQYVEHHNGTKLPNSIDDLLEGLPQGTKKRQILRPSAAIDPLSADGKWRLISPETQSFINFGKRVQVYNNGLLPSSPSRVFDKYALPLVNLINTQSDSELTDADDSEFDGATDNTPFIGVSSQSRSKSVITYYGIENHSKWVFTPMFRGTGTNTFNRQKFEEERRNNANRPTRRSN